MAIVTRLPVAVLAIVPAAVVPVGADVADLLQQRVAVDRRPIDRVDDGLLKGATRQRAGRDGRRRSNKRQDDFAHGIVSISGVLPLAHRSSTPRPNAS